jgi:hypothetical protein
VTLHQKLKDLEAPDLKHPAAHDREAFTPNISITPHREPVETVVAALGSDAARGLTRAEERA